MELLEEIGKGAFGKVWKGRIDSSVLERKSSVTPTNKKKRTPRRAKDKIVAVKMLHGKYCANTGEQQVWIVNTGIEQIAVLKQINSLRMFSFFNHVQYIIKYCTRGVCFLRGVLFEFESQCPQCHRLQPNSKE